MDGAADPLPTAQTEFRLRRAPLVYRWLALRLLPLVTVATLVSSALRSAWAALAFFAVLGLLNVWISLWLRRLPDGVRIELEQVVLLRGSVPALEITWSSLLSVTNPMGDPRHLIWRYRGGKARTWNGFDEEKDMIAVIKSRAPNLRGTPRTTRWS